METEPFLVSVGVIVVAVCLGAVFAPFIADDMRRSVERRERPPTDLTAVAIGIAGLGSWLVAIGAAGWLWVA